MYSLQNLVYVRIHQMKDKFAYLSPRKQTNQPQQIGLPARGGLAKHAVQLATFGAGRDFPFFAVIVDG